MDTGVDPVVLAAQCAHETGWGHFGGAVTAAWNNTCGLKTATATGDLPEDHARFGTIADGTLAHAQHLLRYAGGTVPDSMRIVDPRWHLVTPGTAHTVQELGTRWAPDPAYGHKVTAVVHRLRGT